jgi:hypothetical protein
MIKPKPSFWRVVLRVGSAVVVFSVIGYFLQGWQEHKWWSLGYIESMSIPVVIMPVAVWFMFVPSWFQYSEEEISLRTILRQGTYAWDMLDAYGPGPNVFMLQFKGDSGAYQIFSGAYPRKEWQAFKKYLEIRFPERKCSFSIGGRLIR